MTDTPAPADGSPTLRLSKLEAAARQLDTAIRLWFEDSDPVSVHTLACAAYQIVHDINQQRGGPDLLYDSLLIKDEYRKQWVDTLKASQNFFKHADKDPEKQIEFKLNRNAHFITYASLGLEVLGVKPNGVRAAFSVRQMLLTPEILSDKGRAWLQRIPESTRIQLIEVPKADFLRAYLEVVGGLREAGP